MVGSEHGSQYYAPANAEKKELQYKINKKKKTKKETEVGKENKVDGRM